MEIPAFRTASSVRIAVRVVQPAALLACLCSAPALPAQQTARPASARAAKPVATVPCGSLVWEIGADGRTIALRPPHGRTSFAVAGRPIATISLGGKDAPATSAKREGPLLDLGFGGTGVTVKLRIAPERRFTVVEVVSVDGPQPSRLTFVDVGMTLKGEPGEPMAACALAQNLLTDVPDVPGATTRWLASCEARFGLAGARVALLAAPFGRMREALKEAVTAAPDLPHSTLGGPWALDAPAARGSYLFNFGDMSVEKADDWIRLAHALGITQIEFHGGGSFRFGDCAPNPATYPRGYADFKAVIDKLHAAGIKAGLHTYAFFIDKRCPWVTPVPDRRLAKSASFTLSEPLTASAATVPVAESTAGVSAITGFFVRNSVTLQIDDELITFSGVAGRAPFGFTGCKRGALGTKPSSHAAGARVSQLKECFGLLVPDPKTDMLADVAAKTAGMFNACGFDMIYLDALDGEDILGGGDAAWHYGSAFVYEIAKRLNHPALMEMSTFHHHLWVVRSRMGAWDHPSRSHKAFIDLHVQANRDNERMFLPGELGWWAAAAWSGFDREPTFADDMDYLMAKCAGTDTGFALMGIDPATFQSVPVLPRLAELIRRWETLRLAGGFSPAVKAMLRKPGAEFTLTAGPNGRAALAPIRTSKHFVNNLDERTRSWTVTNPFGAQPLRVRIESMTAIGRNRPGVALVDPSSPAELPGRAAAEGVTAGLTSESGGAPAGGPEKYGVLRATNASAQRSASWAKFDRPFTEPRNLANSRGIGVWVRGDGQGELLNIQLRCPPYLVTGFGDHYVDVDFTGWRYFELVEPEGLRWSDYSWPYGDAYTIYRETVDYNAIAGVSLWLSSVPTGKSVQIAVGPVMALPLEASRLVHPSLTIAGKTIVFPVEMETGSYLEYDGSGECTVYGPRGETLAKAAPRGDAPALAAGDVRIAFGQEASAPAESRARVTLFARGAIFDPAAKSPRSNRHGIGSPPGDVPRASRQQTVGE
jgi:hypothetical protein